MKNCPNCHAQNPDDTNFCTSCGAALISPEPSKKPVSNGAVIVLLILFFPVGLYLMWARTNWKKTTKIIITAIIAVLFVAAAAGGSSNAPADGTDAPTTTAPTPAATTTEEDAVKAHIDAAIKTAKFGKDADVTYIYNQFDKLAIIEINFTKLSSDSSGITSTLKGGTLILRELSAVDGLSVRLAVYFPRTDIYGKTDKQKVLLLDYTPETLKKINWQNFDRNNLAVVADRADVNSRIKGLILVK